MDFYAVTSGFCMVSIPKRNVTWSSMDFGLPPVNALNHSLMAGSAQDPICRKALMAAG